MTIGVSKIIGPRFDEKHEQTLKDLEVTKENCDRRLKDLETQAKLLWATLAAALMLIVYLLLRGG